MIHGELTTIRAVERRDVPFITSLLNDPAVQAGWGTDGVPVSAHLVESDLEGWLETERAARLPVAMIVESLDGEPVGFVQVERSGRFNQSMATLSLAIASSARRQGFGRDALLAVTRALHDDWHIHRVQLHCEAGNEAAVALYEAVGFHRDAVKRDATFTGGTYSDQFVYSALAGEIEA